MSGGRWDYGQKFDENGDVLTRLNGQNDLLKAIEHELDWGLCGDTCRDCSRLRAVAALETFFDDRCHAEAACAVARDHEQNLCPKCTNARKKTKRERLGWWECSACRAAWDGSQERKCEHPNWIYANGIWRHECGKPPVKSWAKFMGFKQKEIEL